MKKIALPKKTSKHGKCLSTPEEVCKGKPQGGEGDPPKVFCQKRKCLGNRKPRGEKNIRKAGTRKQRIRGRGMCFVHSRKRSKKESKPQKKKAATSIRKNSFRLP